MRSTFIRFVSTLAAFVLLVSGAQAATFTPLGDLPGSNFNSQALAVSADGNVVVGNGSTNASLIGEAFRWTSATGMERLAGLDVRLDGFFLVRATGVSADGSVVVGDSINPAETCESFRWTAGTGVVGLGQLGSFPVCAAGTRVSADGSVVVGIDINSGVDIEAFRWTSAGGMVGLGELSGGFNIAPLSQANGVSADGSVVVGYSINSSGNDEAFRWTAGTGMVGLGSFFEVTGVSADGSVLVGRSGFFASPAVIWTQAEGLQDLKTVLVANGATGLDGWTLTEATGISADGQTIVGYGKPSVFNPGRTEAWVATLDDGNADPPTLTSLGDVNGNNHTDLGVLLRDSDTGKNKLYVMDGGSGKKIRTVSFGSASVRGSATVPDVTGDLIPEFAVLLEGSLFARVKDVVNNTLLGKPNFNANFDTVAFLSVGGDLLPDGNASQDVAVVGRDPVTGKVQAWVKDVASGSLVNRMTFSKAFVPFDAVVVDNVGDSPAMEIAVLGIDASGNVQAQVKDALSGKLISKIKFNKSFTPLAFAAVPNRNGKLRYLAVLGRNAEGTIQAQIKRASTGTLVANVRFSKNYDPRAFISFADSNGSGGGEIAVIGVNKNGKVRAQVKEIADGELVGVINFSAKYPPVDAIAVNGVASTGQNEIAVLGENVTGQLRLQIKDLLSGILVKNIPVP